MYETLISYNIQNNFEQFTSIINYCTEKFFTHKTMKTLCFIDDNYSNNTIINDQNLNFEHRRRRLSSTKSYEILTIYLDDSKMFYKILDSSTDYNFIPEVYNNYFYLQITALKDIETYSSEIKLGIIVTACVNCCNHYQTHTEILDIKLVISVTKYENIIVELINHVKSELNLETKEDHKKKQVFCLKSVFPYLYEKSIIFDRIFDDIVHAVDINAVLKDCNLDFAIFGYHRPSFYIPEDYRCV